MAYVLLPEPPPAWPHIICAGSGYAWHDDPLRQACFTGEYAVDAPVASAALDGSDLPGIDRIIAIKTLRESMTMTAICRMFPLECRVCGANHLERIETYLRAIERYIHPDMIEPFRASGIPARMLYKPFFANRRSAPSKAKRKGDLHIPVVLGDPDKTLAMQRAFLATYELRKTQGRKFG